MCDVWIFEAAHDMEDGVNGSDFGEKLIPHSLAIGGMFDQPGDVDELKVSRYFLLVRKDLGQAIEPIVGNGYRSDICVDGAKRITLDTGTGVGKGIKNS